jgi:chromosome partitioning protein
MTKVITFASSKGGTGKSTLCVNIAAYFAKHGQSVLVIDTDPQKSSYDWISESSDKYLHRITVQYIPDEGEVEKTIEATDKELVFIDLQGSLQKSLPFSLAIADVILVPCRPSRDDILGLGWIIELNKEVSEVFDTARSNVAAVLNAVNTRSIIYTHCKKQIAEDDIHLLSSSISQTVGFAEANMNRASVFTTSKKAATQINQLGRDLQKLLER